MLSRFHWLWPLLLNGVFLCACMEGRTVIPNDSKPLLPDVPKGWAKWTKQETVAFKGQVIGDDSTGYYWSAGDPSVLKDGNIFRMFYTCFDFVGSLGASICQAISRDGGSTFSLDDATLPPLTVKGHMLPDGSASTTWKKFRETSFVLKTDSKYLMYFSDYASDQSHFPGTLKLATSTDGVHFSPALNAQPVLPLATSSKKGYDSDAIYSPTVIQESPTSYVMYYAGHCYQSAACKKIGTFVLAATSSDGLHWVKIDEPIFSPNPDISWMVNGVGEPALIKADNQYYAFITGGLGEDESQVIGIAHSANALGPWTLNPTPILSATAGTLDGAGALAPSIIIEGDKARMWYFGFNQREQNSNYRLQVGYAEANLPLFH